MSGYLKKPTENSIRFKQKNLFACPTLQHAIQRVSFGFASDGVHLKPRVPVTKQVAGILEYVPECFSRV